MTTEEAPGKRTPTRTIAFADAPSFAAYLAAFEERRVPSPWDDPPLLLAHHEGGTRGGSTILIAYLDPPWNRHRITMTWTKGERSEQKAGVQKLSELIRQHPATAECIILWGTLEEGEDA